MALSNKLGGFVLTASNKSEMATGYATLYGADMTGAFAVIKDVPKLLVYALARDRNDRAGRALIPDVVIEKLTKFNPGSCAPKQTRATSD